MKIKVWKLFPRRLIPLASVLAVVLLLSACGSPSPPSPRYVFLFIGDGMGLSQIQSARFYIQSCREVFSEDRKPIEFTEFPVIGLITTCSAHSTVTDSAASVTALASGRKTLNGRINIDPSGKVRFGTIGQAARAAGRRIGVISTVSLDHATPGGFYAHVLHRSRHYDIALELISSDFDFFGGGGFLQPAGPRGDQPDILGLAREEGYSVILSRDELRRLPAGNGKVLAVHPHLTEKMAIPYEIDRASDDPSLAEYVRIASRRLESKKGFFIMAEGGKIDWACHDNDAATAVREVIAFDEAVREAVHFLEKHPRETLILVTADHETGGLALNSESVRDRFGAALLDRQRISLEEFHRRHIAPYWSSRSAADRKLADMLPRIEEYFGLSRMSTDGLQKLKRRAESGDREAWARMRLALTEKEILELENALAQTSGFFFGETITRILDGKAGFTWIFGSHTAAPVPVFAIGVGQELFSGFYDNTDIALKLAGLLQLSLE